MAAASRFFRHLGSVEGMLLTHINTAHTPFMASERWEEVAREVEMMEKALDKLTACDPELPVGEVRRLLARVKDSVDRKSLWHALLDVDEIRFYFELNYPRELLEA
jgi:hypothetical protein